jgi:hypothetical protein
MDHSASLVLPCSEVVDAVAKDRKSVYYKGSFQEPAKPE